MRPVSKCAGYGPTVPAAVLDQRHKHKLVSGDLTLAEHNLEPSQLPNQLKIVTPDTLATTVTISTLTKKKKRQSRHMLVALRN
jgi:hypothetical protein